MTQPPRVLIIEDQMMIAFNLKSILESGGFGVVGPFSSVEQAIAGASVVEDFDVAVLDINLGHGTSTVPYADRLVEEGIPFVFVTGYGSAAPLPARFDAVARLTKPVRDRDLVETIAKLTSDPVPAEPTA